MLNVFFFTRFSQIWVHLSFGSVEFQLNTLLIIDKVFDLQEI